eukprot:TRINITY_DN4600_c0_g1_i1.p1 TRINITY_DN4600_c0_g1~~TRINITY_DN4600_c0_g1_i1.p1  ORF type:complete len:561 (+),score=99.04 TRINITY_DN4600_c0_g1_i1:379-2061(+)
MPYYRSILTGTSLPYEKCVPNLLNLFKNKNPQVLSLARLVSREVRENSCSWFINNLGKDKFPDSYSYCVLETSQLVSRLFQALSLVVEMVVASEFARENLSDLFIVRTIMANCTQMVSIAEHSGTIPSLREKIDIIWQIHNAVSSINDGMTLDIDNPFSLIIWGQGLLKLSRAYFMPQGVNDFARAEYLDCLDLALQKFNCCIKLWSNNNSCLCESNAGIGYIYLLKARAMQDQTSKRLFLNHAYEKLIEAENMQGTHNSTYNIACVCSLLDNQAECEKWLSKAFTNSRLPRKSYLEKDPDLNNVRNEPWFQKYISDTLDQSVFVNIGEGYIKPTFIDMSYVYSPSPKTTGVTFPENDFILKEIGDDQELVALHSSLLREGFSINTVAQMMAQISADKKKKQEDDVKIEKNKQRLHKRLEEHGLKVKTEIPSDGNCQMYAVSDQLFESIEHHQYVRKRCTDWLLENGEWILPENDAKLRDFAYGHVWEDYCKELSRNGIWGNHLTLVAVSEVFGSRLVVVSSVEGSNYITEINPTKLKSSRIIMLSHYAEYHYGSICTTV